MTDTRRFILQIVFVVTVIAGFVALTYVNNLHIENLRKINTEHEIKVREMQGQQNTGTQKEGA